VNSFLNDPCRGGSDGHSTAQEDPLSRLGSIRTKHSFTFTPDAGSALVRLALDDKAYQHIWQLPTAQPALTGREWIDLCAEVLRRTPKHMTLSRPIVKLMGLFDPTVREIYEMFYQNEADYVFDFSKIERAFGIVYN
jgi:hypothetical protein